MSSVGTLQTASNGQLTYEGFPLSSHPAAVTPRPTAELSPSQTRSPPFTASVPTFNGDRGASRSTSLISFPNSHTSNSDGACPSSDISYHSLQVPPNVPFALIPSALGGPPHSLPATHTGALDSTHSSEHTVVGSDTSTSPATHLHSETQRPSGISQPPSRFPPGIATTHGQVVGPSNDLDTLSQDFRQGVVEPLQLLPQERYKGGIMSKIGRGYMINYGPGGFSVKSALEKRFEYLPDHEKRPLRSGEKLQQKMSIRFLFDGYPSYDRQVNVATSKRGKKLPLTKGSLAHLSANELMKCLKANNCTYSPAELVLLSIYVASSGSLQPIVARRRM
ncbi:hypothetical protein C8Q74DRAFT_1372155 [Fomes fomentarius]|nr:hypothetical protein C8Q74DRAFT_1372155 [Fomes fomentarius]